MATIIKNNSDAAFRATATIASGAAVSNALAMTGYRGLAVQTPAVWTAANIGFEVSEDGTTFVPLYDEEGARVVISSVATGAARLYCAPAQAWACGVYPYVRLASLDTADGSAENQAAARTLKVIALA